MKKFLLFVVSVFTGLCSYAQPPLLSNYSVVNDTIIERFNRGDYKDIYAMAGASYKERTRESELLSDLREDKKFAGRIISSVLTGELGKVVHYTWLGEKACLNFELWMDGKRGVRFKLNDFVTQPGWPPRKIPTDNHLRSALDSIVHQYASVYMSSPKACALSIGIYLDGKSYEYNYGEVEKNTGRLPNRQTIYTLGSVTKTFIGLVLAKAVTENKLNLQDDIRKYLNGNFPNLEYQGHPVRLVDLATHTWGFGRFRLNFFPADYETMTPAQQTKYYESYTMDSLYRDLHRAKIDTMPGIRYHYSIGSMVLIGLALEKIYGQPLDEIVRNYFGKTFGMDDTKLISDPQDLEHFAKGYNEKGEPMPPLTEMTPSLYTMKTTTADMLKFLKINVEETLPEIKLSHTTAWGDPKSFSLGIFWQVTDDFGQGRWIKHTGYDYGSITMCSLHPDERFGAMIWANDDSRQNNLFDLERNIRTSIQFLKTRIKK